MCLARHNPDELLSNLKAGTRLTHVDNCPLVIVDSEQLHRALTYNSMASCLAKINFAVFLFASDHTLKSTDIWSIGYRLLGVRDNEYGDVAFLRLHFECCVFGGHLEEIPVALPIELEIGVLVAISFKPLSRSLWSVEIFHAHTPALQTLAIKLKFRVSKNSQGYSYYQISTFHLSWAS